MGVTFLILSLGIDRTFNFCLPLQIPRYSKGQFNWVTAEGLQWRAVSRHTAPLQEVEQGSPAEQHGNHKADGPCEAFNPPLNLPPLWQSFHLTSVVSP